MDLFDGDAERLVITSVLSNNDNMAVLGDFLGVEDFYTSKPRSLWKALKSMYARKITIDLASIMQEARRESLSIDQEFLKSLFGRNVHNFQIYAERVKDLSVRRQVLSLARNVQEDIADQKAKATEIADQVSKGIERIVLSSFPSAYARVGSLVEAAIKRVHEYKDTNGAIKGVFSYYHTLDTIVGGFRNSEYIVLGARPSIGKTALLLNMVENIACEHGLPCGIFSIEMASDLILDRMVASLSNVPSYIIRNGWTKHDQIQKITGEVRARLEASPIYIDDTGSIKLSELKSKARRMVHKDGVKVIFIDYIGLINAERPNDPRHEQVALVSREIKALAKELNIPIVVLSQVTRVVEGKQPGLADLRESGSIEQDADVIMFLHRERAPSAETEEIETDIIVAKNRNGATGVAKLMFKPKIVRFYSAD